MTEYNRGGLISGGSVTTWVTPDECLISHDSGVWHCCRSLHVEQPDLCQERRGDRRDPWLRWETGGTP